MRIDSHQHFWHYTPDDYPWISDAMPVLKRDYLPADLKPLLAESGLEGSIVVQARQTLEETEWLLRLADAHDFIKGVVGWVDLCSQNVETQLKQFTQHPKFRGVRHIVHDEPDDQFMLRPDFLHGLGLLAGYNLTYDLLLFPKHLPVALEVVQQFPNQRFVLDHIAKPDIKNQIVSSWDEGIRRLAALNNVVCKVSGLVTEAAWRSWKAEDFTQYLVVVFECFGPDRLMFGSDWPVSLLSADYAEVVAIVNGYLRSRRYTADLTDKIFGGNAAAFYGISL
jgi:L-fuconolactonase